jgi:leucyl aminopeptidase (aminopeptidase T)
MRESDVAIAATTYAITHTEARVQASRAGARVILRGITEDIMLGDAMQADYDEVRRITERVAGFLTHGESVEVTSEKGTKVRFSIKGRKGLVLAGSYDPTIGFAALPDGEAPIAPVKDSVNGCIVFDYSLDSIGLLSHPVTLNVKAGVVTEISGGIEAEKLRGIIDKADSNAKRIAEFAVGTNGRARLTGNLAEDKKRLGSAHFAIGDNHGIGGVIRSSIHLDGVLLSPTVVVDGKIIVTEGRVALS